MQTAAAFVDFMSEHHLTRKDAVITLGGGVAGDMGGFAASIYMRGIDFIQIPTTLLAAVDSSVGGKTGVNISAGKNLMGSFWQPSLVLYDTGTFESLNDDLILDGTAEIIKTAAIRDASLLQLVEKSGIESCLPDITARCVKIKGGIVEKDEKESALRKILNFGHTMAARYRKGFGVPHQSRKGRGHRNADGDTGVRGGGRQRKELIENCSICRVKRL